MKFETVLNAYAEVYNWSRCWRPGSVIRQREKFCVWLLRHEEKQQTEIIRLRAMYCLQKETDQAEIARLQARIAHLERIITSSVEESKRIGAKPDMNELKSWKTIEREANKAGQP